MTRSAAEAVKAALATNTNVPGTCQLATRTWLGAPSVGDVDGDGDADAVDGWKKEPAGAKHTDRKPPKGAPVAWSGGRNGYGHRALSLGPDSKGTYWIRTTDGNGSGRVATVPLGWVEKTWGLHYLGWSETMSGQQIPGLIVKAEPVKPPTKKLTSRGWMVERALKFLETTARHTKRGPTYKRAVDVAVDAVRAIPKVK
jgi:hypothetical protein